jgi:hypothetical protein
MTRDRIRIPIYLAVIAMSVSLVWPWAIALRAAMGGDGRLWVGLHSTATALVSDDSAGPSISRNVAALLPRFGECDEQGRSAQTLCFPRQAIS